MHAHLHALHLFAMSSKLQQTHHIDAHAFASLYLAGAAAIGAVLIDAALERRANALPRHLDEPELRNAQDLGTSAIAPDGLAEGALDIAAMLFVAHVDEVVH